MGADEIFGGYSRYWVSFRRQGYQALLDEMNFGILMRIDLARIWSRNLARDDRAISENSKEVRYPFLDKNLILTV